MSTDAFFFFHMDPENKRGESSTQVHQQYHHQPTASTSSSSVVSRQQFLVEYSPKPTRAAPVPQTPVAAPVTQQSTAQHQAIHKWLANHRSYSYLPHDEDSLEHSAFSDDEEESEDGYSSTSEESSDSEEDDDQIYMAPRRQHSAPLITSTSIVAPVAAPAAVPRRAWPLSAARPAMPVVDRAEATAFTTLQDKSHWSDDEDDLFEDEEEVEEEVEEWIDEDDLPALDADSGAPASTSTRSLPIPIFAPPRTRSNPILSSRKSRLEDAWDASPRGAPRKMIQDGQSFWTPWIGDYIAAQNN